MFLGKNTAITLVVYDGQSISENVLQCLGHIF